MAEVLQFHRFHRCLEVFSVWRSHDVQSQLTYLLLIITATLYRLEVLFGLPEGDGD